CAVARHLLKSRSLHSRLRRSVGMTAPFSLLPSPVPLHSRLRRSVGMTSPVSRLPSPVPLHSRLRRSVGMTSPFSRLPSPVSRLPPPPTRAPAARSASRLPSPVSRLPSPVSRPPPLAPAALGRDDASAVHATVPHPDASGTRSWFPHLTIPECPVRVTLTAITALSLSACGGSDSGQALAEPVIDTLGNGVIQVTNSGPTAWADTNGWKIVLEREIRPE